MMKNTLLPLILLTAILTACSATAAAAELDQQPVPTAEIVTTGETVQNPPTTDIEPPTTDEDTSSANLTYPIVDTAHASCYDTQSVSDCPAAGEALFGQDAQYDGLQPSYQDNGDGTVTDLNTGLTWLSVPLGKMTWQEAASGADSLEFAGYDDWRLPDIKALYSLTDFNGSSQLRIPYLDTTYFDFTWGDETGGRPIDSQYWSSTLYVGTVFNGQEAAFGVNFADGRIKGYPLSLEAYVLYVRGNEAYGVNDFSANADGTVTDNATGLMWAQADDASAVNWGDALATCESSTLAGYEDWRLPNTKELQSIVDYTRSPSTTGTPAIDPIFDVSDSYYWTSTTLMESPALGSEGAYIAFRTAYGVQNGTLIDVHGAGAQRSDPKTGDPADYPDGRGPQADEVRIYNAVRCVRDTTTTFNPEVATPTDLDNTDVPTAPGGGRAPAGDPPGDRPNGVGPSP